MGFKMKPKSPLTMKLAGKSPTKFEIVVDKPVPKERSKPLPIKRPVMPAKLKEAKTEVPQPTVRTRPTPKNKRRSQPVRKKRQYATGAKGLPSSEYLKKREGGGPRSELYDLNTIPYGISPTKLVGTGKRIGPGSEQKKAILRPKDIDKKRRVKPIGKPSTSKIVKKKTNTVGTGFMNPPYKDTVKGSRPYAKRQGYHGYKNFKSILKK
tara:strand:- start:24 stop:650 length:627 start_codon:yes stop_codon:yes gene_type:complete